MFKRIICLVCVPLVLSVSVFAIDKESFMDRTDYYKFQSQMFSAPSFQSLDLYAVEDPAPDSASDGVSFSGESLMRRFTSVPLLYVNQVTEAHIDTVVTNRFYKVYGYSGSYSPMYYDAVHAYSLVTYSAFPDLDDRNVHLEFPFRSDYTGYSNYTSAGFPLKGIDQSFTFDFDISDLDSFNSFELDGSLVSYFSYGGRTIVSNSIDILVNGQVVYSGGQVLNHFIHSGTFNVNSISFVFHYMTISIPMETLPLCVFAVQWSNNLFSILADIPEYIENIDDAQNTLDQAEAIEAEFTGSMISNFEALNIDNFSFNDSLISGFALLSGIFNDIWQAMGIYSVIYVFPLLLGIVLLLIGRVSKFVEKDTRRSSARSSKGG